MAFDFLKGILGKKEEKTETKIEDKKKQKEEEKKKAEEKAFVKNADKSCGLCGQPGADKQFMGQWWHKKCYRKTRKMAKGMI